MTTAATQPNDRPPAVGGTRAGLLPLLLALGATIGLAGTAAAGPADLLPIQPGQVVVTCASTVSQPGYVLAVVDVTCPVDRELSGEWPKATHVSLDYDHNEAGAPTSDWTKARFLQNELFGLALDDANPPNFYVTSTSCYGNHSSGDLREASGWVFKIDGTTGAITQFSEELPNTPYDTNDPDNTGPGLGNIAYDAVNDQLLVTNMEDGKIHLLDPDPAVSPLGAYDPWAPDDGTSGFAPRTTVSLGIVNPDRIWGIGVFDGRAYFGTWSSDSRDFATPVLQNAVYSVAITGRGTLVGPPQHEADVPLDPEGLSHPISDIAFTHRDGGRMMVAERAMASEKRHFFHDSGVHEFERDGTGAWIASSRTWEVGLQSSGRNGGGGTDYFDPACVGNGCPNEDARVIFSATPVAINYDAFGDGPFDVYGLQVSDVTGGDPTDSWWFDIDDNPDGLEDKGLVGDVEYADRCAVDEQPPTFDHACPADIVLECPATPDSAPMLTASDDCDPDPSVALQETPASGSCPGIKTITRTWTATDCDGNEATCVQEVRILDTTKPTFDNCPEDETVDCPAEPTLPTPMASDDCDSSPDVTLETTVTSGPCAGTETRTRTWTATDCSENDRDCVQVVEIIDDTPPSVTPGGDDLACLWPPNHWYVCFSKSDFAPTIDDDCDMAPEWRFADCASDQCDDAPCPEYPGENGDGATTSDCMVSDDWICVRAERAGTDPEGRRYGVSIVAVDDCGNESNPTVIGNIYVPHDQKPHEKGCRKSTKDGCMTPTFPPVPPAAPCD